MFTHLALIFVEIFYCVASKLRTSFPWITSVCEMYTFHWLLLTQFVYCLYNICPYSVSPSAMSRLLCIIPFFSFCLRTACFCTSCLYCMEEQEKKNTCLWLFVTTSCVIQSLPVTAHCFLLPHSRRYFWEHLCINFLQDYRSHAKDNLAWCGFKASVSLWCCSPLPALICGTLYSPMPDGRLKSIIVPTEMCFPEHYIKPQSSARKH